MPFRQACDTANAGLAFAAAARLAPVGMPRAPLALALAPGPMPAAIGFTTPAVTFNRMRALQADAARLDTNVQAYIAKTTPFYAAWTAWYRDSWTPFYSRYAGQDSGFLDRVGTLWDSDALADQETTYEGQYKSLLAEYNTQRDAAGRLVPPIQPSRGNAAEQAKGWGAFSLPWWFWVGATAVVAGGGYLVYSKIQEARRTGKYLREHPEILSAFAGPEAGAALRMRNQIDQGA